MSQHIDPTPKQMDLTSLNSNLDTKLQFEYLIAVNSSQKFTVNSNSNIILVLFNVNANDSCAIYCVSANTSGTIRQTKIGGGSYATLAANGANNLMITVTAEQRVWALTLAGKIAVK